MTDEKKEAIVTFKDAKGREWHPKVTARVIRDFEKVAGIGLFESIFDTFIEDGLENIDEPTNEQVFRMAKKLFGHIGNLTFLLYESCRGSRGGVLTVTDEFKQEVTYDEFCQAIEKDQVSDAIAAAIAAIFGFFPNLSFMEEGGEDSSASPPEAGAGETSTSSPESQE